MIKQYLLAPGPTPIPNEVALAMAETMIHHRTPQFNKIFLEVRDGLQEVFGTKNDVIVLASSGTGAMEAAVSNLTSPGDQVIVITAGKFGERWTGLTKAYGCKVDVVDAPYGKTVKAEDVRARITADTRVVYMQATESSTGARHDVQGIAKAIHEKNPSTLLVVDAITGLGTTTFDVDGWE